MSTPSPSSSQREQSRDVQPVCPCNKRSASVCEIENGLGEAVQPENPTPDEFARSQTSLRNVQVGFVLAALGTLLFALKSIFIKFAFSAGSDATILLTLRMVLSAPFYLVVLWWLRRGPKAERATESAFTTKGDIVISASLGFLGYYLASFLDMLSLEYISAQLERLTLFAYPTMTAILAAIFLRERINRLVVASLTLTYAGIAVMSWKERDLSQTDGIAWGVALVLMSSLSYSIYITVAKPVIQRMGSLRFTSYAMLGSCIFTLVHFFALRPLQQMFVSREVLVYAGVIAFVCTVIPSFMTAEAIRRIGTTRSTIIGTIGPVVTMGLAVAVLHEPSSWLHVAGTILVLCGVAMVTRS